MLDHIRETNPDRPSRDKSNSVGSTYIWYIVALHILHARLPQHVQKSRTFLAVSRLKTLVVEAPRATKNRYFFFQPRKIMVQIYLKSNKLKIILIKLNKKTFFNKIFKKKKLIYKIQK